MRQALGPFSLDRMVNAVEKVRQRLLKTAAVLQSAGIPYAIAGGNAVALWVSRVDEAAVRNTQDVDVLLRRTDFEAARIAMEAAGFIYRHAASIDLFLESPDGRLRDAVHLIFANEKVHAHESLANPDVDLSEDTGAFRVLALEPLVRIKLTAFRLKDRMHLVDLIDVGLLDKTWVANLPVPLDERLQQLLDAPNK